ncbi:hypothetical protein [Frankia sp. EAN1pec]|uniref:hypothetical protein n=1 Tax=Parafrankia sp. (strain EAN1pec) TaxID=298653 RepID=UPI0012F73C29
MRVPRGMWVGNKRGNAAGIAVASLRGYDEQDLRGQQSRTQHPSPVCFALPGAVVA